MLKSILGAAEVVPWVKVIANKPNSLSSIPCPCGGRREETLSCHLLTPKCKLWHVNAQHSENEQINVRFKGLLLKTKTSISPRKQDD